MASINLDFWIFLTYTISIYIPLWHLLISSPYLIRFQKALIYIPLWHLLISNLPSGDTHILIYLHSTMASINPLAALFSVSTILHLHSTMASINRNLLNLPCSSQFIYIPLWHLLIEMAELTQAANKFIYIPLWHLLIKVKHTENVSC